MTIAEFLKTAEARLRQVNIGSARLDCLILLEDELGKDRAWILANQEMEVDDKKLKLIEKKLARRETHEPLAYIRGFSEFYGRKFQVDKNVLEPRPESETMIEMLLELPKISLIADIGTGSGALALTAKLELPKTVVIGVDIDSNCLKVALQNAKNLNADVEFYEGNLLEPLNALSPKPYVLLCNLPYVPRNVRLNQSAEMEPKLAIDGGSDGLELYRRLFEQLNNLKQKPKYILTESLPPQHEALAQIASESGYKLVKTQDLIQLFKI